MIEPEGFGGATDVVDFDIIECDTGEEEDEDDMKPKVKMNEASFGVMRIYLLASFRYYVGKCYVHNR